MKAGGYSYISNRTSTAPDQVGNPRGNARTSALELIQNREEWLPDGIAEVGSECKALCIRRAELHSTRVMRRTQEPERSLIEDTALEDVLCD